MSETKSIPIRFVREQFGGAASQALSLSCLDCSL